MSPDGVRALKTPELIALYNRLTGKSIKRFRDRATGEAQVLKALASQSATAAVAPAPAVAVRTVNGSASSTKGRPKMMYIVQLLDGNGKSKPHSKSDRMALIEYLRAHDPIQHNNEQLAHAARIEKIEAHFGKRMRGVVQKLMEKGWVKRIYL